jgi:hypothetical protein
MQFGAAWAAGLELALRVQDHDCIGTGGHMHVQTLLDTRETGQDHVSIGCCVDRFLRPPDSAIGLAVFSGLLPDNTNVPLRDRFLETLLLIFAHIHRQLVGLHAETGINHLHVTRKGPEIILRVEEGFVCVNLSFHRFFCVCLFWR